MARPVNDIARMRIRKYLRGELKLREMHMLLEKDMSINIRTVSRILKELSTEEKDKTLT